MDNTLQSLANGLREGRKGINDVDLALKTGLTRQSISRALSGQHNFNVTTLLAIAEAYGQVVLLVPRETARALSGENNPARQNVPTMTDELAKL